MKQKPILIKLLAIIFLLFSVSAYAIPNLISYQGVLNDSNGTPMSATVNMTFKLYDVDTSGTALWNETQYVQVSNGLFNVKLGSVQQLSPSIFSQDSLFLGIQVGSDSEMTPRQQMTSGSYAYTAAQAQQPIAPIGSIMAWAKSIAGVPALSDGWVECNGQTLNDINSPLNGQIIPALNIGNKFLRGNSVDGGTGGATDHKHGGHITTGNSLYITDYGSAVVQGDYFKSIDTGSGDNRSSMEVYLTSGVLDGSHYPPYYNVIWIMKVK